MPVGKRSRFEKVLRTAGYVAIALAGFVIVVTDFPLFYTLMGWWCIVGGLLAAVGAATERWAGEYMGLPLLASAMFTFSALTYRDAWDSARWMSVPSIALLFAYGTLMSARWINASAVARAAREGQAHVH